MLSARALTTALLAVLALAPGTASARAAAPAHPSVEGKLVRAYSESGQVLAPAPPFLTAAGTVAPGTGPVPVCPICGLPVTSPDHTARHVLLSWVETGSDAVRVSTPEVSSLPTGATVRVVLGAEQQDATTRDTGEPVHDVLGAAVLAPATGLATAMTADPTAHDVTVVMAVPRGGVRDSATLAQVTGVLNGPVADYWSGQTGGRVHLQVSRAVDWTALSAGCDDPVGMWQQAAAAAGWTAGPGRHLLVYLSTAPSTLTGCAAGLAEVGQSLTSGGRLYVHSTNPSVMAHELGHNAGLMHAAGLQCDGVVEGPAGACRATTYRDYYDVMGISWGQLTALGGFEATQLGVMDAAARQEVSAAGGSGVTVLAPVGAPAGVRALRLSDGAGGTYWVEYRAPAGRDAYLGTSANWPGLQAGVVVRREGDPGAGQDATYLLDPTPSPRSGWDADLHEALGAGATVPLGTGGWYLSVRAADAGGATVDVRRGAAPTGATPVVPATPSTSGAPSTPSSSGAPVPPAAPVAPTLPVVRHEGTDRYDTAAAISRAGFPGGASSVVVASGEDFPDALSAGPTAARLHAPLLLVPRDGSLPAPVAAELARLAPARVTVVGGTASVGAALAAQLEGFAPVARVAGDDRYATAAAVATTDAVTGGTVYLASGAGYADALAGAALAARSGDRLLLTAPDRLPDATARALADLAPAHLVVLGGAASVSPDVETAAAALVPGASVERWAGQDRYGTAREVAAHGYPDGAGTVVLASGTDFPDAVAGAPSAGAEGAPLLLTRPACVPPDTLAAVTTLRATSVVVLGGSASVGDRAAGLTAC